MTGRIARRALHARSTAATAAILVGCLLLLGLAVAGHGPGWLARDAKGNVPWTHYVAIAIALAISLVLDLWNVLKDFWHDYGPDLSPPNPQGSLSDLQYINQRNIINAMRPIPGQTPTP